MPHLKYILLIFVLALATVVSASSRFAISTLGTTYIASGFEDTTDLVGHWTFDTGKVDFTNNLAFDETGKNNGTLVSMSSANQVQGKLEKGLEFDGVADYVTVPALGTFNTASISAWFKDMEVSGNDHIVFSQASDNGACGSYTINSDDTSYGQICFSDSTYQTATSNIDTRDGLWHHGVTLFDGTYVKFYLDGVLVATSNSVTGKTVPLNRVTQSIGSYLQVANFFDGSIDDVRIYNRALTATEVAKLYTNSAPTYISTTITGVADGLVGHWTFDGPDTDWGSNTTNDVSGEGNTGTMVNMSTTTSPTFGRLGQGFKFDGSADYVNVGAVLDGLDAITVSAWVKPNFNSNSGIIASKYAAVPAEWELITSTTGGGTYQFRIDSTAGNWAIGASTVRDQWAHVVGVYTGGLRGTVRIYVDGVEGTPATLGADRQATRNDTINIGRRAFSGVETPFSGSLDDVRIYNRALSAAEVHQLYQLGR